MYKLIIEDDEGKTTVVPLIRDEITIGRKEGNTIRLTERNVSRRHARLSKSNGAVYIEDLQSFNGIRINGDRISGRAPINEGDRVQIGDYQLALKLDKSTALEPAAHLEDSPADLEQEPTRVGADATTRTNAVVAAPPPAADPASERPAKLVVVSSNFAGQEFRLDKAQCVIGRTDENDVVINHRSISRHHAKIVRDQGRYQVVDLGSANGVRVNGEDYGKVELRKGDLIDLGHVRLRFVAPGEDFVFARDAQIVDVALPETPASGNARYVAGALAVLLLLGGGALFFKIRGGGEAPTHTADPAESPAQVNASVDAAIGAERWDEAIAAAVRGLASDSSNRALREKKARAESEKKNQTAYEAFTRSGAGGDSDRAVLHYQELPESSVYHLKALKGWPAIKQAYITDHLARARELSGAGRCEESKKHVEMVLLVDDANATATDIAARCSQPSAPAAVRTPKAMAPRPERPATPRPERPPAAERVERPERVEPPVPTPPPPPPPAAAVAPPKPTPPPPAASGPSAGAANDLLVRAQESYVHGEYGGAIDLARKALKEDPGAAKAWRLIGASSCFLKDKSNAATAWNKISNQDKQFLRYVCQRNGITVP